MGAGRSVGVHASTRIQATLGYSAGGRAAQARSAPPDADRAGSDPRRRLASTEVDSCALRAQQHANFRRSP